MQDILLSIKNFWKNNKELGNQGTWAGGRG
jgi:hypothetical protein